MARFARRARMQKPEEFKQAFENGRRISESLLIAVVAPNSIGHPRLGLAVAKKIVAEATARNRIKRQVRESFRAQQQGLPQVDIVVLSKPAVLKATGPELRTCLSRIWMRIAQTCAPSQIS